MFGVRITAGKRGGEDGEKPFWISFADLMTALMVLFLFVMSVALLAMTKTVTEVTKTVTEAERKKEEREQQIQNLLSRLEDTTAKYLGVHVDKSRAVIDFGDRARFDSGKSQLSPEQGRYLREYAPAVLEIARDELGQKWLKRIVVEGFADQSGDYLLNLNLSLQRGQRVLCALLAPGAGDEAHLSDPDRSQVRDLFLVGGYSFNSAKATPEESRRIELRLEFYGLDEEHAPGVVRASEFGVCRI